MDRLRINLADTRVLDLMEAWGVPYSWGAGKPSDGVNSWPDGARGLAGGRGWDCSGLAQACLVRLGLLHSGAPDRTAAALFDITAAVLPGGERLGDLAFYGVSGISHVAIVLGPGVVMGANGGGSTTNADDPRAFVRLERLNYRADFRGVRRFSTAVEAA